jgi:hypothetical protein
MQGIRLVLLNPEMIGRTCDECKRWVYYDDGKRLSGTKMIRRGKPVARPPNLGTPCWTCPKAESFEEGSKADRRLPRVLDLIELADVVAATGGRCLSDAESVDVTLMRDLGIVNRIEKVAQADRLARVILPATMAQGRS